MLRRSWCAALRRIVLLHVGLLQRYHRERCLGTVALIAVQAQQCTNERLAIMRIQLPAEHGQFVGIHAPFAASARSSSEAAIEAAPGVRGERTGTSGSACGMRAHWSRAPTALDQGHERTPCNGNGRNTWFVSG